MILLLNGINYKGMLWLGAGYKAPGSKGLYLYVIWIFLSGSLDSYTISNSMDASFVKRGPPWGA